MDVKFVVVQATKQVLEASKLDGVQWVTLTPDEIAEQFPSW